MLETTMIYPATNETRLALKLDDMWHFRFDPKSEGDTQGWKNGIHSDVTVPVPGSFQESFTDSASRTYCGDFWYEYDFFVPSFRKNQAVQLRFGSIAHRSAVYLNGTKIGEQEGGYLPVLLDITDTVKPNAVNKVVVKANNELNETSIPCGAVKTLADGRKIAKPYFDFFNYAGIQRSVWLHIVPKEAILDYDTDYRIDGENACVKYSVTHNSNHAVHVVLKDVEGNIAAEGTGAQGELTVQNAHLWDVRAPYLYTIEISLCEGDTVCDVIREKIGIRTVRIEGTSILLNGKPVYLKGFGKHEDFPVYGKGFSWPVVKYDFECMKWIHANCFRTSHYPYAEEWYRYADEQGFLIIDEVPAVGMMRSTHNFVDAGTGKYTYFFETPTVGQLKEHHISQVRQMITRDKNHPSVIAFSLFNEPETTSEYAEQYFRDVFEAARKMDPQKRPLTGAFEKNSSPEKDRCVQFCDFVCLNRYYGWYISGGEDFPEAEMKFRDEMDRWKAKNLNKPFVFTEFGCDTLETLHSLSAEQWSQEYQQKYMEMNFRVFDDYDFVQGELAWAFADFQTSEGIFRVGGNKKGVFTRDRKPKQVAQDFRRRWETKTGK